MDAHYESETVVATEVAEVLVLKIAESDELDSYTTTYSSARGTIDGFIRGGSPWHPINHGVRIIHKQTEEGAVAYWDFLDYRALSADPKFATSE